MYFLILCAVRQVRPNIRARYVRDKCCYMFTDCPGGEHIKRLRGTHFDIKSLWRKRRGIRLIAIHLMKPSTITEIPNLNNEHDMSGFTPITSVKSSIHSFKPSRYMLSCSTFIHPAFETFIRQHLISPSGKTKNFCINKYPMHYFVSPHYFFKFL